MTRILCCAQLQGCSRSHTPGSNVYIYYIIILLTIWLGNVGNGKTFEPTMQLFITILDHSPNNLPLKNSQTTTLGILWRSN